MLLLRQLLLLSVFIIGRSAILKDTGQADVEAVRIRLEEEKAKRLLLQNDVEVLMLQVEELKRNCEQKDHDGFHENITFGTSNIGFTARLTALGTKHGPGQTVIFDEVLVNEGECYDSSTGKFRAPFRGLYSFSASVLKERETPVHLIIVKDNIEVGRLFSGTGEFGSGSVTVLTVMDKDQSVYVKQDPGYTELIHGNRWSTFTGVLHNRYN